MPKKNQVFAKNSWHKKEEELKFNDVTYTPLTTEFHMRLDRDFEYLRKKINSWCIASRNYHFNSRERALLLGYIQAHHNYTEYDQFDSQFSQLNSLEVNLEHIKDVNLIYKSFDLFKKLAWPVRFSSKIISRLADSSVNQIKYILGFCMYLASGNFNTKKVMNNEYGYVKELGVKIFPYNRFFSCKIFKEKNLIVHVGVEKVPVVGKNGSIKRYEYTQYLHFVDLLGDSIAQNPKKLEERMQVVRQQLMADVAKTDHSEELIVDTSTMRNGYYLFEQVINPYTEARQAVEVALDQSEQDDSLKGKLKHGFDKSKKLYHPLPFKVYYVSTSETSTLIFDKKMKRWISKDHLDKLERKKLNEFQRKINEEMVKRFVDFNSAKTLVELLTKIPNFKVKLTEQQKDVIGENGNVMAIGRSGTGKTTCAVLRLFSIEMLFKIRTSLYKKKFREDLKNTRCSADDIDNEMGLHCMFLTASPVLTNEIQRYYKKLTQNIKEELEKKRKRVEAQRKQRETKEGTIKEAKESAENDEGEQMVQKEKDQVEDLEAPEIIERVKSRQDIEEEKEMNKQLKDIELKEDIENENFNEDEEDFDQVKEEFEEKIKRFQSLHDLEEADYPGFFTVKRYIMMIDGVLNKPFFIRSKNISGAVSEQSKAAWHNERKGVMMIENYFKNEDENTEVNENQIDDLEDEINYSDEEELEHEYMRQIQLRENKEKQELTKKLERNKKKYNSMSFEVDFDYFLTHFWPTVHANYYSSRNITPQLVWTEIYSTIKGSADSHLYGGQYLTEYAYKQKSSNVFLSNNQKKDIYETFCQYERWKINNGGYDLLDAVNYVLNYIRFRGYDGPEIHYVMIDEVQDLPHAIVYLLSKTASYGVFYSGDTAQTIAKGVGFRFCDLKSLFDNRLFDQSLSLVKPAVKQLTVNFRSHNNILQMANSVITCLELLFPKTIDKLSKERSDLQGPKPMILAQSDEQMLFYVLCGEQSRAMSSQNGESMKKPPLEFGCDQVIIVRDQESKEKVPGMLQHALCLTIYEAKGLEFNDVILFNFFSECKFPEKWNLLKYLRVVDMEISKEEHERNLTRHQERKKKAEEVDYEEFYRKKKELEEMKEKGIRNEEILKMQKQEVIDDAEQQEEEEICNSLLLQEGQNQTIRVKKIVSNVKKVMRDINDYAELCSDLKLFYTAITRPRKTLIIYDEDPKGRKVIEKMWQDLDIIQVVTRQLIEEGDRNSKNSQSDTSIFKRVVSETDSNEWKKQGLKMYTRGYFEQAMKCFEKSQSEDLFKKAKANLLADRATKALIDIESQKNAMKNGSQMYEKMKNSEISKLKKQLKHKEVKSFEEFNEAAIKFEELKMLKQAGQCYFSGRKYKNAHDCFIKAKMLKQAAQSLEMQSKFADAAVLYDRQGEYLKAIECLDMINEWEQILKTIKKYESQMSEVERTSLLKKYAALALEALVYEIQFENDTTEENPQQPKNNRVEVIQEQESDEEEDFSSEESKSQKSNDSDEEAMEEAPQQSQVQNPKEKDQAVDESVFQKIGDGNEQQKVQEATNSVKESVYQKIEEAPQESQNLQKSHEDSESFSDLNQTQDLKSNNPTDKSKEPQKKNPLESLEDESFSDLNEVPSEKSKVLVQVEESFSDLNTSQDFSDLNVRYEKQLEPDLESIKSLADPQDPWLKSIGSVSEIAPKSEYSIIDESENYNMNVKIIKTKGNIFIQDQIMEKIIRIVSFVSSSSTEFFKQFKGYQSLITLSKDNKQHENIIEEPLITDFEDIDSDTINVILDTLESFKLYKLCLFVCNRYHLPEKAGRYLISIILKYSTSAQYNTVAQSGLLAPSTQRKAELEKGILGSMAVHSVLENVSNEFLKVKISSQKQAKNSLGTYFIQGLILEGFYKKSVFMVNPEEGLHILDNFGDFEFYREVCKTKFIQFDSDSQTFLKQSPKSEAEKTYTLLALRDLIQKYQVSNRYDTISSRYFKQFNVHEKINSLKSTHIPNYLPFTQNITQNEDKPGLGKFFDLYIPKAYQVLLTGNEIATADCVLGLLSILHSQSLQWSLMSESKLSTFLECFRCLKYLKNVLFKSNGPNCVNILRTILVFYQCKLVENYKSMSFLGSGYCYVDRTSTIANEFVELVKGHNFDKKAFAYFVEQDFNYIMVELWVLIGIISTKFQDKLEKFYKKRIDLNRFQRTILPEDFSDHNCELVLVQALKEAVRNLQQGRDQRMEKKKKKRTQVNIRKDRPSFDYKTHGKQEHAYINEDFELSSDDENFNKVVYTRELYVLPNFSTEMSYLSEEMISIFNRKSREEALNIANGKELYCCNLNSVYKEYVDSKGGYNLYDAIEYKKFKRIDMYADNILSVIDNFSLSDKHVYAIEVLVLLLVEYKKLIEGKKFTMRVPTCYLKFFEGLTCSNSELKDHCDLHRHLLQAKESIMFEYSHHYVSELNEKELSELICEFLEIVQYEESSQFVSMPEIFITYLLNAKPDEVVYEKIRKIVGLLGSTFKNSNLRALSNCKNRAEFLEVRNIMLNDFDRFSQVRVQCDGDLDKCIEESQFDYEVNIRIDKGRKKALSKIVKWWKEHKIPVKERIKYQIVNYFDNAIKVQNPVQRMESNEFSNSLREFRMLEKVHNTQLDLNIFTILKIEKTRRTLLSFYLGHIVSSSLDFHYILITLRKIEEINQEYMKLCRASQSEIIDIDIGEALNSINENIEDIESNINVWKNDSKWLKEKNLQLKKKKVFEVKWMTKSMNQMKVIRKRAGQKKQEILERKKRLIKMGY